MIPYDSDKGTRADYLATLRCLKTLRDNDENFAADRVEYYLQDPFWDVAVYGGDVDQILDWEETEEDHDYWYEISSQFETIEDPERRKFRNLQEERTQQRVREEATSLCSDVEYFEEPVEEVDIGSFIGIAQQESPVVPSAVQALRELNEQFNVPVDPTPQAVDPAIGGVRYEDPVVGPRTGRVTIGPGYSDPLRRPEALELGAYINSQRSSSSSNRPDQVITTVGEGTTDWEVSSPWDLENTIGWDDEDE